MFDNSIWNWTDSIAVVDALSQVTLGEGKTPLIKSRRIGPQAGIDHLYFKIESANPSGSYKDRFAAVAVSDLVARGSKRCLATSSGNTGAALATYCAAAGIECVIAIVESTPEGKLTQMLAHGARLIRVRGFGVDPNITTAAFEALIRIGQDQGSPPQISAYHYSPIGMTGVQTISYELVDQLAASGGRRPDHIFAPAGGGGLCLALALGFERLAALGQRMPRVDVVQPEGNDTIASPLRNGLPRAQQVQCTSKISGLQVPTVIDGDAVISHCRSSGGTGHVVSDESVWLTQQRLAREEGLFCEPAGAVALTGALHALAEGKIDPATSIICLITGSGFKDPHSIERMNQGLSVPALDVDQLMTELRD